LKFFADIIKVEMHLTTEKQQAELIKLFGPWLWAREVSTGSEQKKSRPAGGS